MVCNSTLELFQDTVIGLQALSEFAELVYTPDIDFTVQLTSSADPSFSRIIKVDHQNSMVLQLVEVNSLHLPVFLCNAFNNKF